MSGMYRCPIKLECPYKTTNSYDLGYHIIVAHPEPKIEIDGAERRETSKDSKFGKVLIKKEFNDSIDFSSEVPEAPKSDPRRLKRELEVAQENHSHSAKRTKCDDTNSEKNDSGNFSMSMNVSYSESQDLGPTTSSTSKRRPLGPDGEGFYHCSECNYKSMYTRSISRHYDTSHLGIFKYRCQGCSMGFCDKRRFRSHEARNKQESGEWTCEKSKTFKRKSQKVRTTQMKGDISTTGDASKKFRHSLERISSNKSGRDSNPERQRGKSTDHIELKLIPEFEGYSFDDKHKKLNPSISALCDRDDVLGMDNIIIKMEETIDLQPINHVTLNDENNVPEAQTEEHQVEISFVDGKYYCGDCNFVTDIEAEIVNHAHTTHLRCKCEGECRCVSEITNASTDENGGKDEPEDTKDDSSECSENVMRRKDLKIYSCHYCSYSSISRLNTERHIAALHKEAEQFRSPKVYYLKEKFEVHQQHFHKATGRRQKIEVKETSEKRNNVGAQNTPKARNVSVPTQEATNRDSPTIEIISQGENFKCRACDYSTKNLYNARRHIVRRHDGQPVQFSCKNCSRKLYCKALMEEHSKTCPIVHYGNTTVQIKNYFEYKSCRERYASKRSFEVHSANCTNESGKLSCLVKETDIGLNERCAKEKVNPRGSEFYAATVNEKHISTLVETNDKESSETSYQCSVCSLQFKAVLALTDHFESVHIQQSRSKVIRQSVLLKPEQTRQVIEAQIENKTVENSVVSDVENRFLKNSAQHRLTNEWFCLLCRFKCQTMADAKSHFQIKHFRPGERTPANRSATCPYCNAVRLGSISLHIKNVHLMHRDFACKLCGREFSCKRSLYSHICKPGNKTERRNNLDSMFLEHRESNSNATSEFVENTDPGLSSHPCSKDVNKTLTQRTTLSNLCILKSREKVGVEDIVCKYCDTKFRSSSAFKNHERACAPVCSKFEVKVREAENLTSNFFKCSLCDFESLDRKGVFNHLNQCYAKRNVENLPSLTCKVCDRTLADSTLFGRHVRINHEQISPFSCRHCGQAFYDNRQMASHHSRFFSDGSVTCKKYVYVCKGCRRELKTKSTCLYHIKVCGSLSEESPNRQPPEYTLRGNVEQEAASKNENEVAKSESLHSCCMCSFKAKDKHKFASHVKEDHRDLRAFFCSECGRNFSLLKKLVRHLFSKHVK